MNHPTSPVRIAATDPSRRQRLLDIADILQTNTERSIDLRWPDAAAEERALGTAGLAPPGPVTVLTLESQLAPHSPLVSSGLAAIVRRDEFQTLTVPLLDRSLRAGWQTTPEILDGSLLTVVDAVPRRLSAFIQVSDQLTRQNPMMAAVFAEAQLLAAVAGELDRAALQGSGANDEPLGIANDAGLPKVIKAGTTVASIDLTTAEETMATGRDEQGVSRWLAAPDSRKTMRGVSGLWPVEASGPLNYAMTTSPDAPTAFLALCQPFGVTYFIWKMSVESLLTVAEGIAGWRTLLVECWCDVAITRPKGIVKITAA